MNEPEKLSQTERAQFRNLGTDIDIQIVVDGALDAKKAKLALSEIRKKYAEIEKKFSRFAVGSELSYLNNHLKESVSASAEMLDVVRRVLDWHLKTEGYFDPRIIAALEGIGYDRDFAAVTAANVSAKKRSSQPGNDLASELLVKDDGVCFLARMDFSGIVKGWATDKMAQFLFQQGWQNFLVDSGGDMFFAGKDEKGKPWYVDVEGIAAEKMLLQLSGEAVATSGISKRKWESGGERVHHLINPKDQAAFSFDLRSVTVVAKSTEEADVWAKTIFLLGKEKGKILAKEKELPCVILEYNGSAWISPAMQKHI